MAKAGGQLRVIPPFNRAIQEFHTQEKAPSGICYTINYPSFLPKLAPGGNNHLFARLPGSLADYASAVRTDIFRNRSLSRAGVFWAFEVYRSHCGNALLDPAVENPVVRSRAPVHSWGVALWAGTHSRIASHDELNRQSVQPSNRCSSDLLMRFTLLGILLRVTMLNIRPH